jgi:hypothetical protein
MELSPLREDLRVFLQEHNLEAKWKKTQTLFINNIRHPSLHVELLEPHWRGISLVSAVSPRQDEH